MKRFAYLMLLFMSLSSIYAEERDMASLKAQYTAWLKLFDKNRDDPYKKKDKFILQIGDSSSYFYDPQTFYFDSLANDPTGRVIIEQALHDALQQPSVPGKNAFDIMEDKGLIIKSQYKCKKNYPSNSITVWDNNGSDVYQYEVDMNDLSWNLGDSIVSILDYECQLATADYHGRKWKAWFTTDIPVRDGPWQLCGLPGLIMKAEADDGECGFEITGLQQCHEPFKPTLVNPDKLYKSKRTSFLKMKDYSRRNRSAMISAMTNGKVTVNADYTGSDDFLETDYHE